MSPQRACTAVTKICSNLLKLPAISLIDRRCNDPQTRQGFHKSTSLTDRHSRHSPNDPNRNHDRIESATESMI